VSAPFDTRPYFGYLNPLVRGDIDRYFGSPKPDMMRHLVSTCVVDKFAGKIRVPVFVAGGSRDSVLPHREANRIMGALPPGEKNTLKIYNAGHGCLDCIPLLLKDVVDWLEKF
jgi:pimeloyl-ACP methyl ester carboxylesterase